MRRHVRKCLFISLALAIGSCHGANDRASMFTGMPYVGSVKAQVSPPGKAAYAERGKGNAQFTPTGRGRTQLSVIGAIVDPRGDAGFKIDGAVSARGWRGQWGDVHLDIDQEGRITGGGVAHRQKFTFSGSVSPSSFDLVVDIELLAPNKGGLPRGTEMQFIYDLARRARPAEPTTADKRGGRADMRDCKAIRYVVRPVPDPAGGTLVMRRVPVCKD